ncbi:hypothetical protein U1Q18_024479 [Sarracenia purpurea var. burkii]
MGVDCGLGMKLNCNKNPQFRAGGAMGVEGLVDSVTHDSGAWRGAGVSPLQPLAREVSMDADFLSRVEETAEGSLSKSSNSNHSIINGIEVPGPANGFSGEADSPLESQQGIGESKGCLVINTDLISNNVESEVGVPPLGAEIAYPLNSAHQKLLEKGAKRRKKKLLLELGLIGSTNKNIKVSFLVLFVSALFGARFPLFFSPVPFLWAFGVDTSASVCSAAAREGVLFVDTSASVCGADAREGVLLVVISASVVVLLQGKVSSCFLLKCGNHLVGSRQALLSITWTSRHNLDLFKVWATPSYGPVVDLLYRLSC